MTTKPEVSVTLSNELFERLSIEATELGVPLEWLVASIVVDTFESKAA